MKWAGMYFFGFVVVIGALLAALWKLGILAHVDKFWVVIGVALVQLAGAATYWLNGGVLHLDGGEDISG